MIDSAMLCFWAGPSTVIRLPNLRIGSMDGDVLAEIENRLLTDQWVLVRPVTEGGAALRLRHGNEEFATLIVVSQRYLDSALENYRAQTHLPSNARRKDLVPWAP